MTSEGPGDGEVDLHAEAAPADDQAEIEEEPDIFQSKGSASITSSITGYQYENGRRYHAYREGAYYLPNDEAEQARLDLVHHVFRLALGGSLYCAPLPRDIGRCLDFGTGTGIWAIDFAEEFQNADVIGTDLSPIQPTWIPTNLRFYVDNVEDDWTYSANEAFDFVHARCMGGAIEDWQTLLRQILDNLNPGAWCEVQDYEAAVFSLNDPSLSSIPNMKRWVELLNEASAKFGKELNICPKMKRLLTEAGFVGVQEKVVKVPIGPWAKDPKFKEMGIYQREQVCDSVDSYTLAPFTRVLGWTPEECTVLMAATKKEIRDPRNRLYAQFWFTWGRKPEPIRTSIPVRDLVN